MSIEKRHFFSELRADGTEDRRTLRGHAAVFDTLSQPIMGMFRERILPGAFDGVLQDDVRALFNHDPNIVLGRTKSGTLKIGIDERGLTYEVDLPNTQQARDLWESVKRGDISQSSFAFSVEKDEWRHEKGEEIREVQKVAKLMDVSPVAFPAYTEADVDVRSVDEWKGRVMPDPKEQEASEELKNEFNELRSLFDVLKIENENLTRRVKLLEAEQGVKNES
jgi:uncharacterized protein